MTITTTGTNRLRHEYALALTGATLLGLSGPAAADVRFEPEVAVGVAYSDNIDLADTATSEEVIIQVLPTLRLGYDGTRLTGELAYRFEHYAFTEESDRDASYHQVEAQTTLAAIPDALYLDLQGLYAQTLIDPLAPIAYSNIIATPNRADYFARSITPRVERDLGRVARVEAAYELGWLDYEDVPQDLAVDPDLEDFDQRSLRFSLTNRDDDAKLGWEARFYDQKVDFESSTSVEYRIAQGRLAWRVRPGLQLLANGGRESDVRQDQARASLDATIWNGGFRWEPNTRGVIEATVGERWFGDAYALDARFTGRRLDAGINYEETTLTVGQQLFRRPVLRPVEPDDPLGGLGRNTPDVYLSKAGYAWAGLAGRRNRIDVTAYDERRTFLTTDQLETERGSQLGWTHWLGPRTTVGIEGAWARVGYIGTTRNDEFVTGTLTIRRQLGARSELELIGRHSRRTSDEALVNPLYEENSASLSFRWSLQPLQRETPVRGMRRPDAVRGREP